jgi:hypothetical protein
LLKLLSQILTNCEKEFSISKQGKAFFGILDIIDTLMELMPKAFYVLMYELKYNNKLYRKPKELPFKGAVEGVLKGC